MHFPLQRIYFASVFGSYRAFIYLFIYFILCRVLSFCFFFYFVSTIFYLHQQHMFKSVLLTWKLSSELL